MNSLVDGRSRTENSDRSFRLQSADAPAAARAALSSLLGRQVRVELKDGVRQLTGKVYCVDGSATVVLAEAVERVAVRSVPGEDHQRRLPLVVVPGDLIEKLYVRKSAAVDGV